MHKFSDLLDTLGGISSKDIKVINSLGFFKLGDLYFLERSGFNCLRSSNLKTRTLKSIVEHSAIYCNNKFAINLCKQNLNFYKRYKYYLHHETSFRMLPEGRSTT